ncbi:MAG: CoA transferase [Acidimicrobiales bacterium]
MLDFSQVLAGPTVTRLMVELGANVIKIEMTPAGDMAAACPESKTAGRPMASSRTEGSARSVSI